MKNIFLTLATLLAFSLFVSSQTLFTYGKHAVELKDFQRAYNKVSTPAISNKEKSIREYLNLFIISKLKIKEAYERGYDTLPIFKEELATLRSQVVDNYMSDPNTINFLIIEAFTRSQKDIHPYHIYIPFNGTDTSDASLRINKAYNEISSGKKFEEVAKQYSADPLVNNNNGSLGYITVFSLPYEFENIVYSLSPGKTSTPYKSGFGYHIFKNAAERKAIGRMSASQILLAYPPGSDEATKKKIGKLADSLYAVLQKGGDFTKLASQYSNDYISNASGGQMREFGTGTYDPLFESRILSLQKDGAFTAPFATSHGYHIVKRISHIPVSANRDKNTLDGLRRSLDNDPRINISNQRLYDRIVASVGYKWNNVREEDLFAFADSLIDFKRPQRPIPDLNHETVLFKLGDKSKTANDYINFAVNNRFQTDGRTLKPGLQVLKEFKLQTGLDYYRDHMEQYNEDFRNQMNDFKEGNLFFEIMMQDIWGPAQGDSLGQRAYFEKHRSAFTWKHSADAVVFYCSDETLAKQFVNAIKKAPSKWREQIQHYLDRTTVDSGRFELSKIPGLGVTSPRAGLLTSIVKNKDDNSATFAYILKVYNQPAQKSFTEAKGDIITAYQDEKEAKWIEELKKKYPIKINEDVLRTIIK